MAEVRPVPARPSRTGGALLWWLAALHAVCPIVFFTDLTRNPYVTQIALLIGGLALGAAAFATARWRHGSFSYRPTPVHLPLAAFTCVAALSWAFSAWTHPPFRWPVWNEGVRVAVFFAFNAWLAFEYGLQLGDRAWDRRLAGLVLIVGSGAAAYGVLQYLGHEFIWSNDMNPYSGRPVSTFGNPNFLSSYLVILLPVALEAFAGSKGAGRWLGGGAFLLCSAAIMATSTRSSWIGALTAVGLWLLLSRRLLTGRKAALAALLAGGLMLAVFWPSSPLAKENLRPMDRIAELARGISGRRVYGSWHQRLMIWSVAWDMARENPVLGKGFGTFELFYPYYQGAYLSDDVFKNFRTHANNAHQLALEIWSQTGTAGMGAVVWLAVVWIAMIRKRAPDLPADERRELYALAAGGAGMLADNTFGNVSVFFAVPAFLFFWSSGVAARRLAFEPPRALRRPLWAAAGLILLGAAGAVHAVRYWKSEVLYFEGFKAAKSGRVNDAIALLERARSWRRWEVNNNYELGNAYARRAQWAREQGLTNSAEESLNAAIKAYTDAIRANAGYDEIFFNRGAVLGQAGRLDEARFDYRTALLINPLSKEAYRALGNVYLSGGDADLAAATDLFGRAVFFFPRETAFWNNLGYVHQKAGRQEDAVNAFRRTVSLDITFEPAWRNLGVTLRAMGKPGDVLLRVPEHWNAWNAAFEAGRFDQAAQHLAFVRAALPGNGQAQEAGARLDAALGRYSEAEALLRDVLARDPDHPTAAGNLARVVAAQGRAGEAVSVLEERLQRAPSDADAASLLERLRSGAALQSGRQALK